MYRSIFAALGACVLLGASACDVSARDENTAASIPLDMSGPRPLAQLVIGDAQPVMAIFDTGAAASVLRLSYAQRLGLPNQGHAAARGGPSGAPVQGFRTTIDNARLGAAAFGPVLAVAFDIQLPLPGVDAIISPEVFSGRFVRFDFAAGVAQVLPRTQANTPAGPGEPYIGENTHARITQTPSVRVTLPGAAPVIAMLDTGSRGGLSLPHELSQSVPLAEPLTPIEPMRLVGAEHPAFSSRINGVVQIGALALENPEVRFVEGLTEANVGIQILRNAVVVLDPQAGRSWVLAPAAP